MIVGICRMTFSIPGNDSLKGKRAVIRSLLDRMRSRFNVAAAEVDDLDAHQRAVIGFAVVSNDTSHVHSMLDTVTSFASNSADALMVDRSIELVHYNGR